MEQDVAGYVCTVCKSGLDEEFILICNECDLGYHINCHQPVISKQNFEEITKDDTSWKCQKCTQN